MDFEREIVEFVSDKIGGITIVALKSGEIMYADKCFTERYGDDIVGQYGEDVYLWLGDCPTLAKDGSVVEWESIDTDTKKYYRIDSALFTKENQTYQIHKMIDITEYMGLNSDVTKYMAFFKRLAGFQTAVLEKLSSTYYELLPVMADYFQTNKVYFLIQRDEHTDFITYNKVGKLYSNDRVDSSAAVEQAFQMEEAQDILYTDFAMELQEVLALSGSNEESRFRMLCKGSVSGQKYAVYLSIWSNMDMESMREQVLLSVIRLYLENGIMRETLIYESEHDRLSGLYNKGKYMRMLEEEYQNQESIGIFNFDVNNLKVMNDTYGHEAGDKLLMKAANSIRKVTSNKVHGYRLGGDEFLMVACDVTEQEVAELKERWEQELARLNTVDDGINCVIAAGVVYGEKPYDLSALMKQADELMYEDKKRKKKPGEEIR
jgi:diguanylate cyclase (GGDEF)-like protein